MYLYNLAYVWWIRFGFHLNNISLLQISFKQTLKAFKKNSVVVIDQICGYLGSFLMGWLQAH